jgi:hypothetical protein
MGKRAWKFIWRKINDQMAGIFTLVVCVTLLIGWRLKGFELITASHGLGYAFGISGVWLMVILFVYPLRKRSRGLDVIGSVTAWFRIHMVLGVLGPMLILFHANFHLGSLNSNVALFSMLIVAASGVFGRYIYSRIHYGLYGQLADLIQLQNNFEKQKEEADTHFALIPGVKEELVSFANNVLVPSAALIDSIKRLVTTRWNSQQALWKVQRISAGYITQYARAHKWGFFRRRRMQMQIQRKARVFLNQAIKVVEFNFYDRLFAFWHILHIPLVFILVLSVLIHAVAINRY